jgi:hypothetical protein
MVRISSHFSSVASYVCGTVNSEKKAMKIVARASSATTPPTLNFMRRLPMAAQGEASGI